MDIRTYLRAPVPRWLALGAVISTSVASLGVSYFTTKKRLEERYDILLDVEVERTKRFYANLNKVEFPTPQEAAEKLLEPMQGKMILERELVELKYTTAEGEEGMREVVRNVWTNSDQDFDLDEEKKTRDPSKPYILEHDEFFNNEKDYITQTLTWYEGDGVLANDRDEHLNDVNNLVGEKNLEKFGHGSRDPNVLYVANERLDIYFEIVKHEGKFTEEVLGFIQHDDGQMGGNRRRVLRMREYDDD
jgi:hypothetical protein